MQDSHSTAQDSVAIITLITSHRPWHHLCSTTNSTLIFPAPKRLGMGIKRRAAFEKTSLMSDKSSVRMSNGPHKSSIWSPFAENVAGTDRWAFALSTSTECMECSVFLHIGDERTVLLQTEAVEFLEVRFWRGVA